MDTRDSALRSDDSIKESGDERERDWTTTPGRRRRRFLPSVPGNPPRAPPRLGPILEAPEPTEAPEEGPEPTEAPELAPELAEAIREAREVFRADPAKVKHAARTYPAAWVLNAVQVARSGGAKSWGFVLGVLRNFAAEDHDPATFTPPAPRRRFVAEDQLPVEEIHRLIFGEPFPGGLADV